MNQTCKICSPHDDLTLYDGVTWCNHFPTLHDLKTNEPPRPLYKTVMDCNGVSGDNLWLNFLSVWVLVHKRNGLT